MTPTIIHTDLASAYECTDWACQDSYCKYVLEEVLEHEAPLPMPIWPWDDRNKCDCCGEYPSAGNPTTTWPGQPADPENGPSPNEIPHTVCDRCTQGRCDLCRFEG